MGVATGIGKKEASKWAFAGEAKEEQIRSRKEDIVLTRVETMQRTKCFDIGARRVCSEIGARRLLEKNPTCVGSQLSCKARLHWHEQHSVILIGDVAVSQSSDAISWYVINQRIGMIEAAERGNLSMRRPRRATSSIYRQKLSSIMRAWGERGPGENIRKPKKINILDKF